VLLYCLLFMKVETWSDLVTALLVRKVSFLVTFFIVFLLSYALLSWLDFLPEPVSETTSEEAALETGLAAAITATTSSEVVAPVPVISEPLFPDTIIIDTLDREVSVLNPTSRSVTDLDAALLYGVVRHPDSATLEQSGTVFVLGHSSYLPTVLNRNFQAFNGIQNLEFGDTIRLQSGTTEFVYRVERVYRAKAQDVTVPIAGDMQRLVLATCNSFGSVDDRYIVEAGLLETKAL
jgi:LPXTG-site transpeptidase (sortase) family protein